MEHAGKLANASHSLGGKAEKEFKTEQRAVLSFFCGFTAYKIFAQSPIYIVFTTVSLVFVCFFNIACFLFAEIIFLKLLHAAPRKYHGK